MAAGREGFTVMTDPVAAHMFAALESTPLAAEPFPHLYVEQIFPGAVYRAMVDALPPSEFYERQPTTAGRRLSAEINHEWLSRLPEGMAKFWMKLGGLLNSQDLLDRVAAKFSHLLPTMRSHREYHIAAAPDGRVRVRPRIQLSRARDSFAQKPHTDSPSKFIVGIFYLPRDQALRNFGTSIYTPRDPMFRDWIARRHPVALFNRIETFPCIPNTMFMFMKSDHSFHGVEPQTPSQADRNVMFWLPEIVSEEFAWPTLSLPVSLLIGQ